MKLLLSLTVVLALYPLTAAAAEETKFVIRSLDPDNTENTVSFDYQTGLATATNGVEVLYGATVLTADTVRLNQTTGDAKAEGNVVLQQDQHLWRGEALQYNFKTGEIVTGAFRTGSKPFYAAGDGLSADITNQVYTATNAIVTTDDVAQPFYRVRARQITIAPGQFIEARGATLYLGDLPVMYFPYYQRSLSRTANHFEFTPGYRSRFGPFLLSSYHWFWDDKVHGALNFDYRQERGIGAGPSVEYDLGSLGRGQSSLYYADDERPGETANGTPITSDRYRLSFSHQTTLRSNFTARASITKQSDPRITRDFFEGDYRDNPQPNSFLELDHTWPNFDLNLIVQPQLNDFFQTVERLPDLKLTAIRQQLGDYPLFYESENSFGHFRFRSANNTLPEYEAARADTFHQLLLPKTFFGWLNVTPRAGGRFTHYREIENFGDDSQENRAVFNTGVETSFKASRVWPGLQSDIWHVDGIRHIIEPSVNYSFVPHPSARPRDLPQFDTELPSFRLLPIEFPDYSTIDSIDSQNVLRLGLRNKVQTKRDGEIDNLLNWALFTDWRLDPRREQSTFADLFSDADLKPRSWLVLNSEIRYDLDLAQWRLANHRIIVLPNNVWSVTFGHRYFKPGPNFNTGFFGANPAFADQPENNIFFSSIYYRLNENWGVRLQHHFEATDGVLEEQSYTLYRDMRSWTGALSLRWRDHREQPDDFTIAISFSIKAYPRNEVGRDSDRARFLLGG